MRFRTLPNSLQPSSRFQPKENCELINKLEGRSTFLVSEFGRAVAEVAMLAKQDDHWNNDTDAIERASQVLQRHQLDDVDDGKELVSAELLAKCAMCHLAKREEVTVEVDSELL